MGRSRSLIFIPGNNQRFLEKAKTINSDILCFDLEDSVPVEKKESARELVNKTIQDINKQLKSENRRILAVRINAPQSSISTSSSSSSLSSLIYEDLKKVITTGIDSIVIPKVEDKKEVVEIVEIIEKLEAENNISKNHIKVIPSIESALGVVNAFDIASSDHRVSAIVFGIFDFLHDMKIDNYDKKTLTDSLYGRAKVPVDARAARVDSIDCIWQDLQDTEGLLKDLETGKRLGYTGKCVIHPSQIDHVHTTFEVSKNDIEWAKKVITALDNAALKTGAIKLEGKMIDAVHYKQAKRILEEHL